MGISNGITNRLAWAAETPTEALSLLGRSMLNVPRAILTPRLDASPLDAAWATAATIPALTLSRGSEERDAPLPTRVQLMWDEKFLYVRFECKDAALYAPFDKPDRDQELYRGDCVEVFLDVVGDGRQVVEIQLAPGGQVFDQQLLVSGEPRCDGDGVLLPEVLRRDFWAFPSWNCKGLQTATRRTATGWIGELALPAEPLLRRLGRKTWGEQTFRAHLMRYKWVVDAPQSEKRRLLSHNWASVRQGRPHISPQAMGVCSLR